MKQPIVWETEWLDYELKERGIFDKLSPVIVDCGAGDGEYCSNAKLFIKKYDWRGILIDGLKSNIEKAQEFYKGYNVFTHCSLLSDVVEPVFFEENPNHWSVSKITNGTPNAYTNKLSTILHFCNVKTIGILSLDIEGHESKVLFDILEHHIKPQVIIVEGNDFKTMQQHRDILHYNYGYPIGGIFPNQFFVLNELK